MTPYWLVLVLLLIGGGISLIENERARRGAYTVYLCFAVPVLFLFAGLRSPDVDADYNLYADWFHAMTTGTLGQNPFLKDPSFAVIGFGVHAFGLGIATLIAIYSAACLAAQLWFIRQAVDLRWLPLAVFLVLCRFLIPHEMTQIRAAVAIPIMSVAILQFQSKQPLRGALLLLLALSIHFSTVIALPLCIALACGAAFRSRGWLLGFVVVAGLGYTAFSRVAILLALFARTSDYVTGAYETTGGKLLSMYLLSRVIMVGFAAVVLWNKLPVRSRLILICSAFGIMLEIALSSNDALATRSGELFGMFDVASAIMILSYLRRRTALLYVLFLLCLGGTFYRSTTKIVQPYSSQLPS